MNEEIPMAQAQPTPDISLKNKRPIEFRSMSEEVAVGGLMGGLTASVGVLIFGGLVGALGARLGELCGGWHILGGSIFVWLAFWYLPLSFLMTKKPIWRFLAVLTMGIAYLVLIQWHIHQRDIGKFYPWILTALPFGILLGTIFEPIRLARGGSTESYIDRGVIYGGGIVGYGNRNAIILASGYVLGFVADLLSLGRQRIGATIGGLLGGGISALASSSVVAWRGDANVADLFFGNVWNIAWAGTALGAVAGAVSGWCAASIRERQQQQHRQVLDRTGDARE